MTVKKCMNKDVITVTPDQTLVEALDVLFRHKISGMPVVDNNNNLLGVISKSDILTGELNKPDYLKDTLVQDIMTTNVCVLNPNDPIKRAVDCMTMNSINRIPIVQNGKIVGIITRDDIISDYAELKNKEMGRE